MVETRDKTVAYSVLQIFLNVIIAAVMTISTIGRRAKSQWSGHNERLQLAKVQCKTIELDCIRKPWRLRSPCPFSFIL